MSTLRSSTTGLTLALFAVACGSGTTNSPESGGSSSIVSSTGGSGNHASGGQASSSGGVTGQATDTARATGGSTPGATGGTTGKATGGTSATNTAANTGGATANGTGGRSSTGGGSNKAAGGTPSTGGSVANPSGGTSARASGGSNSNASGGSVSGGSQGNGGTQSTGGAPGTGGSTTEPVENTLVTSASGAYWKTGTWTEVTTSANVTINDASASQTWDGFGGAFNEKGWSFLTTQAMKDEAIQLLFGKDGCNFAWGRIPIGASDYAMDRYSLNESSGDTSMSKFSIDRDKQKLIPYIQAALAVKPGIRFWASPWSPPTWMKTGPYNPGSGPSNSNFDGGVMKNDETTLKAFALYLVKFVQAYAELGINVVVVSPQNEPNYQQNYPSCHWESSTFVTFVGKYFGPALTQAGLSTKIMDGTLSNPSGDATIGSSVLQDATAKGYIGSIGVQWGMSDANQVSSLKNAAGGIPIWLSETKCGGTMGSTSPAPNDLSYGKDTWGYIRDAIKNGLTAYNAWNMVLDPGGLGIDDTRSWPQNALLVASSGKITATPAYYVFRHFSQFADVGAKVVATSGGDAIGFKNPDGSLVAVMYNSGSANNNYVVSIGGKKLQFAMPGSGWATIKYKP